MITKRNIVAGTISFVIVMSSDVSKPRYFTSEPVEHFFAQLRTMICEFTTLEFAQLCEKLICHLEKVMYKCDFSLSRDPNKGETSTFGNYFNYSVATNQPLVEGTVQLLMNRDFVAKQLWSAVNELITFSSSLMTSFLSALGVTGANSSPVCREFTSLTVLRDELLLYLPFTFDFDNVHGTSRDEGTPDDNGGDEDERQSPTDIMQERVIQFQQAIVAISEEDGAVTEEEECDDDVVVVDDTEDTASNSTLMSDAVTTRRRRRRNNDLRRINSVAKAAFECYIFTCDA